MIDFTPSDEDMALLPLEVTVYIKVSVVSLYKEDNYDFLRYFFSKEDIADEFYDLHKTVFYDFDGSDTKQKRFVTVFELYAKPNYRQISEFLQEVLYDYEDSPADVIMDFYTHDNKAYRLSNLDGIVKLEAMNEKAKAEEEGPHLTLESQLVEQAEHEAKKIEEKEDLLDDDDDKIVLKF